MGKIHYQFSSDTTQRLADARSGKIGYNIVTKQPYTISQTKPSVQDNSNDCNKYYKPLDLDDFLKETEGLSYEEIRNGMNRCYTYKKR